MHRVRSVCFRVRPNWIDPFGINFKYHKRIVAIYRLSHLQGRREKTWFEKFKRTWNLIVIHSSEFRLFSISSFCLKITKIRVLPRKFGFRKLTSEFEKHPKVHKLLVSENVTGVWGPIDFSCAPIYHFISATVTRRKRNLQKLQQRPARSCLGDIISPLYRYCQWKKGFAVLDGNFRANHCVVRCTLCSETSPFLTLLIVNSRWW